MSEVSKIPDTPIPVFQEEEIFKTLLHFATENDYSFALWRLPNDTSSNLILSFNQNSFSTDNTLEDLPEGFLFAPFDTRKDARFLKADLSFTFNNGRLAEPVNPLQVNSLNTLNDILSTANTQTAKPYFAKEKNNILTSSQQRFEQLVQQGILEIEAGKLEKIVPSRARIIDLPPDFNCIGAFRKLCVAYPTAMVSLVSITNHGTWIGATPEMLVNVDSQIFRTIALAGTKAFEEGTNLKQVAWTQKEIEEQALVSRYIINCFKKIRLREFEEHGPKTMVAGNLMHLKTEFTVDMQATNFPQLGSVMLKLLHPTSAVCGMPLEAALEFLKEQEGYDREFYAGYFGPVNVRDTIHLFVNLRCMQLLGDRAVVYAGAGVTVDSVPLTEWEETEMKMNTLLKVIL